MMYYRFVLFFLAVSLLSCRNGSDGSLRFTQGQIDSLFLDSTQLMQVDVREATEVDLNPFLKRQAFEFGEKVVEVRLVPLETTDESLVADIYNIVITDSMHYIHDNYKRGGIVIFDKAGRFVRRISPGRGPGELYRLNDIAYDEENGQLLAYQPPFLLFYTPSGEFIRQVRLPFGFYNFLVTPGGYLFKTLDRYGNGHLGDKMDNTLLVTDKNFKLKYAGLAKAETLNYSTYNYMYSNDGEVRITHKFCDTIYRYVNETAELKAEYILDFGSKKFPERYLQAGNQDFHNVSCQNDYYYFLGKYMETTHQNVFFLRNDYLGFETVIYRDKRTGNMMGGTHVNYNVNEIPAIGFPRAAFGEYLVSLHYPNRNDSLLMNSSLLTETEKQRIGEMKEDDNPMLVYFRLREF